MEHEIDRIECAIRHIESSLDVDPWACEIAVNAMRELIKRTHGWIPVTEALPEDACQCIVTAKVKHVDNYPDYEVDTADFADGIFTTNNSWWGVESIIAWMPLPEPWEGQDD